MTNITRHKLLLLSIVCANGLLSACSGDEIDDSLQSGKQEDTRTLILSMPITADLSAENNPQVFLYRTDNDSLVASLSISENIQMEDGITLLQGFLPDSCGLVTDDTLHCRAVVLVNTPTTTGVPSEFSTLTFDASTTDVPLFGLREIHQAVVSKVEVLCPVISLVRASAQVTVRLSDELKQQGVSLIDAQVPTSNEFGFCAPMCDIDYANTESIPQAELFHPYVQPYGPVSLGQNGDGSWQTMLVECANSATEPLRINIWVSTPSTPAGTPYSIFFKNYDDDTLMNIVRGNHYIFTVKGINTDVNVSVEVNDWQSVTAEDVIFK